MSSIKKTVKSGWTPLNSEETNIKMFEERRVLVNKWFDKWTDEQRRKVLDDLIGRASRPQAEFAVELVRARVPLQRLDFTRELPRALCLYIFSFLDPRSLCRSAQVCWYWKVLAEADEVWMPKAARLNWFMTAEDYKTAPPDPLCASNLWKRYYLSKIRELQVMRPNMETVAVLTERQREAVNADAAREVIERHAVHLRRGRKVAPWRGPDPRPVDTWRNNYLENAQDAGRRSSATNVPKIRARSGKRSSGKLLTSTEPRPVFDEEPVSSADALPLSSPSPPPQEVLPLPSYPRPGPPQRLVLRRRSPQRTERDLPSHDLFKAAASTQAINPPPVPSATS